MALSVTVSHAGAVTILRLEGRVSLGATVEYLRKSVLESFEAGHKWLLLDMDGLSSADSAGVGELVSIYASIARRGGALKFLRPSRKLKDMFHVTRLETLFEWYDDEDAAIASFVQGSAAKSAAALNGFLE